MVRIGDSLKDQRVFITQSQAFMGPVLCKCFRDHGAQVIADESDPQDVEAFEAKLRAVTDEGAVDVVIANLAIASPMTRAHQVGDEEWRTVFAALVDPLPRIARAFLPAMMARKRGKLLVMGSATALRGQRNISTYAAARGGEIGRKASPLGRGGCLALAVADLAERLDRLPPHHLVVARHGLD